MTTTGPRRHLTVRAAALGVLAAALLLGVADVVAALTGAARPVVAVGQSVVRLAPPTLTATAIELFGTRDKQVLLATVAVAVAAVAAIAGILARRSVLAGAGLAAVTVAVGVVAAVTAPTGRVLDAVPAIVGALVAIPLLLLAVRRSAPRRPATPTSRRAFLSLAGAVSGGAVVALAAGQALARRAADAVSSRAALRLPGAGERVGPPPATTSAVVDTTPFVTSNDDFYRIDTALEVPQLSAEEWRLRIHGLVDREIELDWADLTARESVERWITLVCVSNEVGGRLNGNAVWQGTLLADLLAEAGPADDADMILSTSVDGFTASTPLDAVVGSTDAVLAYGMNGEPLPLEHGFPVRMLVPGLYGYVSATKWLVDLEVTRYADRTAFWTTRGYSAQAPIKVSSRIDVPGPFAALTAGPVPVAGMAWAPGRGIDAVEVRVDGGPWQAAQLVDVPTSTTWRQWSWTWDATAGNHTIEARATDGEGSVQIGERAPIKPDGTTGWHSVVVRVA